MRDVEKTIISQYGNSATISKLIYNMNSYIRPDVDIDNFYDFVFNVETAQGFGLDIWGRIVNVDREVLTNPVFYLDDTPYRALILLKALSNLSASTSPSINQLLTNWLPGRGRTYVNDLGKMNLKYTFEFALQPFELLILKNSDIFLRPAGVGATIQQGSGKVFGFREGGTRAFTGFNQAPFRAES